MLDQKLLQIYDEMYSSRHERKFHNRWDTPIFDEETGIPWDEYVLACYLCVEGGIEQAVKNRTGTSILNRVPHEEIVCWVYYCARKASKMLKKSPPRKR